MVSHEVLAVAVVVVWNVALVLGYWLGGRSERAASTWLLEELRTCLKRCRVAEEELAQERARHNEKE